MGSIKGVSRGKYSTRNLNHREKVQCLKCGKSYKRRAILLHHIRTKHMSFRVTCPLCEKRYVSVSVCNRHLQKVHHIFNHSQFNINLRKESNSKTGLPKLFRPSTTNVFFSGKLSFEADKAFPCMANVLSMQENAKFGKHIKADRDIDVGQVVIITPGYSSIDCLSSIDSRCFNCGNLQNNNFIQCPHCISLWFCSKKCYANKTHRMKCKKIFMASDCHIVRLVTEMITVAFEMANMETVFDFCRGVLFFDKKHENLKPPFSSYGEMLRLKGRTEESHFEIAKRVAKCIFLLPRFKPFATQDFQRMTMIIAYRHAVTIGINVFSGERKVCQGISTRFVMYDVLSRLNHSCSPNVHHVIDENHVTHCVAIRPIKKGDQIFISYLGEMKFMNDQERKTYITETWEFTCQCQKCSDLDKHFSIKNTSMEEDSSYQYLLQHFEDLPVRNKKKLLQKCVRFLRTYGNGWSEAVDFVTRCFISLINTW